MNRIYVKSHFSRKKLRKDIVKLDVKTYGKDFLEWQFVIRECGTGYAIYLVPRRQTSMLNAFTRAMKSFNK